nr:hypothetical protein [Tanacetum cinerariifolium]
MAEAFSKIPYVIYQNYLREFWYTAVVVRPNEDFEPIPLKESYIKFTVQNGGKSLYLDYKTFCQSTRLKYSNGQYTDLPQTEAVKAKILNIGLHNDKGEEPETLANRTPILKTWFLTASGVPPKEIKGKKHTKPKKTSLIQSTLKFTHEKELPQATNTSQSVSSGQSTNPQDTKGNKQPVIKELPSTKPKDGTRKSMLLPEGKTTDPQDLEGNKQPADMGLLSTSDEGIRSSKPLPEGKSTDAKDSEGNIQPTDMGLHATHPNEGFDTEYQVDKTQSTQFEILMEDSDDELKELIYDDIFKAGEDMDDLFPLPTVEETRPPLLIAQP